MIALPAPPLGYWVHDWSPFLVRFTDTFGIRYYGLAYVAGFFAAAALLIKYARAGRSPVAASAVTDLMFWLVIGVLAGGRLGYFLFYKIEEVISNPLVIVKVWEGGMSFHGGLAGVVLAMAWYARSTRIPLLRIGDVVASVTPVGLFFGRFANFINGELFGRPGTVPWAVIFPQSEPPGTPIAQMVPRHPSQLYEATLEGLVLFVFLQWRFWRTNVTSTHPGRLMGEAFVSYSVARITCEFFREPDASLLFGLSRGMFYSLILMAAGCVLIVRKPRSKN